MATNQPIVSGLPNALVQQAIELETPCGSGMMVWRKWGSGAPLILLHGGFGSWNHWCRNIVTLSREFTVIAPDLPGLGDSEVPGPPATAAHLAEILLRGLEDVLRPTQRFHLGCFSFGAVPGSLVAVAAGERLCSFTLIGAAGFGPRERPTDGLLRIRTDMDEETQRAAARNNLEVLMFADPAGIDETAVDIQLSNTARARFRSRPLSLSDTVLKALPEIKGRCNAIWGREDITAAGMLARRNALLREVHPEAEIVVMDNVGHWVQYEAADAFNACYLEMLRRSA